MHHMGSKEPGAIDDVDAIVRLPKNVVYRSSAVKARPPVDNSGLFQIQNDNSDTDNDR